ncbi:MAG: hypothetical protein KC983_08895 [Phycisphaerales bacterium]|nr:hypothetical protein [Phycisphaerales bacterium]
MKITRVCAAMIVAGAMTADVIAVEPLPFTEMFDTDASNWRDVGGVNDATWFATGGVDDSGYISTTLNVPDPVPPFGVLAFRAQNDFGSSNGAFEGNWLTAGVSQVSLDVRHNGAEPIQMYIRVAGANGEPGAVVLNFAPVSAGAWTTVTFDISPSNPGLIPEGVPFETAFSNVGRFQIGAVPGSGLVNTSLTLDIDNVTLLPAPGVLFALAPVALMRRRRRNVNA